MKLSLQENEKKILVLKNLLSVSDYQQAEKLILEIIDEKFHVEEMLRELVNVYLQTKQIEKAITSLNDLIKLHPGELYYYRNQSKLYLGQGDINNAIECYLRLIKINEKLPLAHFNLAILYKQSRMYESAIESYRNSIEFNFKPLEEVYTNLGVIYSTLRNDESAKANFKIALNSNRNFIPAKYNLAGLYEELGEFDKAYELYDEILLIDPQYYNALIRQANNRKVDSLVSPLVKKLKRASRRHDVSPLTKEGINFSLAKIYDDCASYQEASIYYKKANECSRHRLKSYNKQTHERDINNLIEVFSSQWFNKIKPISFDSPIFICGMFRSGSTLLEQVLSGHPCVSAAGEINYFDELVQEKLVNFPQSLKVDEQNEFNDLSNTYQKYIKNLFPKSNNVTDKRPENYIYIGLIKTLFPNARIIYTSRDSLDNCLSIYFQQLSNKYEYANNLDNIVHYYNQYKKIMRHWKLLFKDEIYEFKYEGLIMKPRQAIAAVLEYLELDWSDDCLQFNTRNNLVKTASIAQVRKPLYTASCKRWKNYLSLVKEIKMSQLRA